MTNLINPPKEDRTATWIHMPSRPEVEPRGFPYCAVKKLLADKNKGWEICEAPFVSPKISLLFCLQRDNPMSLLINTFLQFLRGVNFLVLY